MIGIADKKEKRCNSCQTISKKQHELLDEAADALGTEFVTYQQWDARAAYIFRSNIKKYGESLSRTGIAWRASGYIVEIRPDQRMMIVKTGWREAMKQESADDQ